MAKQHIFFVYHYKNVFVTEVCLYKEQRTFNLQYF